MPKAAPFLSSSNAGEFSPRMDARTDFEKYGSGISRGLNLICLPHGGLTRRPGTRFVKEVKDSSKATALVPFEPVSGRAYMLELGDLFCRFYRNQGRLTAPTTTAAVTNGIFAANITSWTDRSTGSATIAWSSSGGGRMALNGAGDGHAWAEQSITVPTAQVSVLQFQLAGNPGSKATVQIGTSSKGKEILEFRNMGMGWHTVG